VAVHTQPPVSALSERSQSIGQCGYSLGGDEDEAARRDLVDLKANEQRTVRRTVVCE